MRKLSEQSELQVVELYNSGLGCVTLSRQFNLAETNILSLLRRHKVAIRKVGRYRKYTLNETIFDEISSPDHAYWLGFIAADGSVSQNSLRVELNEKDVRHLFNLAKFLSSDAKIVRTRKNCYSVNFNSKRLLSSLNKHGIIQNKTSIIKTPILRDDLYSHFYRGVFDGDGWLTSRPVRKKGRTYGKTWELGFSSGSLLFIEEIHLWVCRQLNRRCGYLIHRKRKNQSVYQLTFGGNKLFKSIVNFVWTNNVMCLERKKEAIFSALASINSHKRKSREPFV